MWIWEEALSLNPTRRALSLMKKNGVECLLMGGQACVLYGAAEFSRDADLAIHTGPDNLERLKSTLGELKAEVIAVPPFEVDYLEMGLAVHFRCHHPECDRLRIDVMSKMRGVDDFTHCWKRRTTITDEEGNEIDLLSLPDLVQAKKTQRDKDWPMIRRLIETDYFQNKTSPADNQVFFWFRECLTAEILCELAKDHPEAYHKILEERPVLSFAQRREPESLSTAILEEIEVEKERDRAYWAPLKQMLEELRKNRN